MKRSRSVSRRQRKAFLSVSSPPLTCMPLHVPSHPRRAAITCCSAHVVARGSGSGERPLSRLQARALSASSGLPTSSLGDGHQSAHGGRSSLPDAATIRAIISSGSSRGSSSRGDESLTE